MRTLQSIIILFFLAAASPLQVIAQQLPLDQITSTKIPTCASSCFPLPPRNAYESSGFCQILILGSDNVSNCIAHACGDTAAVEGVKQQLLSQCGTFLKDPAATSVNNGTDASTTATGDASNPSSSTSGSAPLTLTTAVAENTADVSFTTTTAATLPAVPLSTAKAQTNDAVSKSVSAVGLLVVLAAVANLL
ncbi:hypothetical protein HDU97_005736 [Phlyctochytrium planicorne]|nr:hypothetical protein HDU97_005736 [Phlyctochytrium planicorne]